MDKNAGNNRRPCAFFSVFVQIVPKEHFVCDAFCDSNGLKTTRTEEIACVICVIMELSEKALRANDTYPVIIFLIPFSVERLLA